MNRRRNPEPGRCCLYPRGSRDYKASSDFSLPLSSYLSLPPFVASLGILSGSSPLLLFAPIFSVPLLFSLFLLHLLSPFPLAFLLRFSSSPPLLSLKVFAQTGSAQRGSTFCAVTQSACSPPWQTPRAWCRLWSSAIIACCYYVPPTILGPPMLMYAVDHLVHYCLLALSLLLQVAFLPSQARYSSLWCLFVVSSLPFHRRGGLSGTSLWHIVRLVFQCSSPPLWYPAWVLSSPYYDPFMTAFPLFLWATPDWSACGILSGLSPGSLIFPLLPPYLLPTSILSCFNLHWILTRFPGIAWSPHPL